MNLLTRDRVVPTIPASVSWLIFPMIGSGTPPLSKFANKMKRACQVPLARIEQLIDQVLLDPERAGQKVIGEKPGKPRLLMEHADHSRLLQSHDLTVRQGQLSPCE